MELLACDVSPHSRPHDATTIVELGKKLLQCAKNGETESVRELMCRGAPFTTDWVCALTFKCSYFIRPKSVQINRITYLNFSLVRVRYI